MQNDTLHEFHSKNHNKEVACKCEPWIGHSFGVYNELHLILFWNQGLANMNFDANKLEDVAVNDSTGDEIFERRKKERKTVRQKVRCK